MTPCDLACFWIVTAAIAAGVGYVVWPALREWVRR